MQDIKTQYLTATQRDKNLIITSLPAKILINISYAAQRGLSQESGAVQRLLNPDRISKIKKFTIENGNYPGSFVLNWVHTNNMLEKQDGYLIFKNLVKSAQIIDGQHRVAGIRAAIEESAMIGDMQLPVVIYENLTTRECADIFLSINTEQKPVPRSLVFDLYGIASEPVVDPAAVRARDIAMYLKDEHGSPYFSNIKVPGDAKRKGGIALSTAVTALKPLVEEKGSFEQLDITELETQKTIVFNFFTALQLKYGDMWDSKDNAFQYASGFMGAIDFFRQKIINYCDSKNSFRPEVITEVLNIHHDNLILQDHVKGLGGKDAPRTIYKLLLESFKPAVKPHKSYEV